MSLPPPLVLFPILPKHTPCAQTLVSGAASGETQWKTLKDSEHQLGAKASSGLQKGSDHVPSDPISSGWDGQITSKDTGKSVRKSPDKADATKE